MWQRIKDTLANVWGKFTTILLSSGVIILSDPYVQSLAAQNPMASRFIQLLGVMILIARVSAPPKAAP